MTTADKIRDAAVRVLTLNQFHIEDDPNTPSGLIGVETSPKKDPSLTEQLCKALGISYKKSYLSNMDQLIADARAKKISSSKINAAAKKVGLVYVDAQAYSTNEAKQKAPAYIKLADYINSQNPGAKAYVYRVGNNNWHLQYTSKDGSQQVIKLTEDASKYGTLSPTATTGIVNRYITEANWINTDERGPLWGSNEATSGSSQDNYYNQLSAQQAAEQARQRANAIANANAQIDSSKKILDALGVNYTTNADGTFTINNSGSLGSQAPTNRTITADELKQLTSALPSDESIENNTILNGGGLGLSPLQSTYGGTVDRISLAELMNSAKEINDITTENASRNIKHQRDTLLKQIQNDPTLYAELVAQLNKDAANNTILGQRAANAGLIADAYNTDNQKQIAELYKQLFGENAASSELRSALYGNNVSALDAFIRAQLGNAASNAYAKQASANDLSEQLAMLGAAANAIEQQYGNEASKANAKVEAALDNLKAIAENDAELTRALEDQRLQQVINNQSLINNFLNAGGNGSADVSAAIQTILNNKESAVPNSTYTKSDVVGTKELDESTAINNALLNEATANAGAILNAVANSTGGPTASEVIEQAGLNNILDSEQTLQNIYRDFTNEANRESDRVFNQAQRAYIASVLAGDTKTTEQLVKLAATAGNSKRNLYSATALQNQFKQQRNNSNLGATLKNDYLNQQSENAKALAYVPQNTATAYSGYLGNGYDSAGTATVYGIQKQLNDASNAVASGYSRYAQNALTALQNINNTKTNVNINDFLNKNKYNNTLNSINAANAVNNAKNATTKQAYATDALANLAQGNTTLNSFK